MQITNWIVGPHRVETSGETSAQEPYQDSTQAIVTAAAVLVLIAALAVLDAERNAPGTHITSLAGALWWAATTVTTVGYGDTFPITGTALMLVGISLVGVITATIAAWFIDQTRQERQTEISDLAARLDKLEATVAEIHAVVVADRTWQSGCWR